MRRIFHLLGILFHLISRDGGKITVFHPKVESFHWKVSTFFDYSVYVTANQNTV